MGIENNNYYISIHIKYVFNSNIFLGNYVKKCHEYF